MQGLLARLRSSQGAQSHDTRLLNIEDGLVGKPTIVNNNVINTNSDGRVAEEYVTRALESALSVDSNIPDSYSDGTRTDIFAIEAVMASNKARQGKDRRINSSASSSKMTGRSSKIRGSRVSLNSVTLSEREDLDTSGMESDDDTLNTSRSQMLSTAQLWAQFENTVKSIDNSDPDIFIKKPKPNFVSSETFQKVMVDMYGNTEYGNTKGYTLLKQKLGNMARSTTLASRMLSNAMSKGQEDREREEEESEFREKLKLDPSMDVPESIVESATKSSAKRGWRIMKRQVHEQVMEQKTQGTKVKWNMISHTVKQMSNMEKARQDLYERYGILPTVLDDGSVVCENRMLSERARVQTGGHNQENKRPSSYQPPPTFLRNKSKSNVYASYAADGRSSSLSNRKLAKRRPMTAKSVM